MIVHYSAKLLSKSGRVATALIGCRKNHKKIEFVDGSEKPSIEIVMFFLKIYKKKLTCINFITVFPSRLKIINEK